LLVVLSPTDIEPVTVVEVQAADAQVPLRGVRLRGIVAAAITQLPRGSTGILDGRGCRRAL
jgi:hypothetical protein